MNVLSGLALASVVAAAVLVAPATAGEPATKARADDKILVAQTFRSSQLSGMNVRNMEGEALGTVADLVIDLKTGKVQYVAVSVGGFLGLGDKLLAVPFGEFKFNHGQDEDFFVLNMSKEKIAAAPGFDKDNWPNFADPRWAASIDEHYRKELRTGEARSDERTRGDHPNENR